MSTPLVIDDSVRTQIRDLCEFAATQPVDMPALVVKIQTPAGKKAHMQQMTRQTIKIPLAYMVTFSIETGHPCGTCRHMSMSVQREGRAPNPVGLWMVAELFGFKGDLTKCSVWQEDLRGHGLAINVVQPLTQPV